MSEIRITGLYRYPVKACAAEYLTEAYVTPAGIEFDRAFMLVDEEGVFISQRTEPSLAAVQANILGDPYHYLQLQATDMKPYSTSAYPSPLDIRMVEAQLHDRQVVGQETDPAASAWFSRYLSKAVRLIRVRHDKEPRIADEYVDPELSDRTLYNDAFALLLTSTASLSALHDALETPKPMNRFRPNIVIDGIGLEAYDEDYWRRLQIGELLAGVVKPCARCAVPDVDQFTGERDGTTVRKALKATRRGVRVGGEKINDFFGVNLQPKHNGAIHLGDEVTIFDRTAEPSVQLL